MVNDGSVSDRACQPVHDRRSVVSEVVRHLERDVLCVHDTSAKGRTSIEFHATLSASHTQLDDEQVFAHRAYRFSTVDGLMGDGVHR